MTKEELLDNVMRRTPCDEEDITNLEQWLDLYVKEVIGEDETDLPSHSLGLTITDSVRMANQMVNNEKAEQRKRAGLC